MINYRDKYEILNKTKILNKNISVRPVIGERKTNIIRANNSILNSSKINKKSKL